MTWVCVVKGCFKIFEQGPDHLPEPCPACWKKGWRVDAVGNVYKLKDAKDKPIP